MVFHMLFSVDLRLLLQTELSFVTSLVYLTVIRKSRNLLLLLWEVWVDLGRQQK